MSDIVSREKIILSIISNELAVNIDIISGGSRFKEDLGADSLDVVQIIIGIEEALSRDLPDSLFDGVRTVKDLLDVIESGDA